MMPTSPSALLKAFTETYTWDTILHGEVPCHTCPKEEQGEVSIDRWLCTAKDCGQVHCGQGTHAQKHAQELAHGLQLNLYTGAVMDAEAQEVRDTSEARRYQKAMQTFLATLCAENATMELLTREQYAPLGLINLGNTCYASSGLQLLANVAPLRLFLHLLLRDEDDSGPLTTVLTDFFAKDREALTDKVSTVAPTTVLRALQRLNPDFTPYQQHVASMDAAECLRYMIDRLNDEYRGSPLCKNALDPKARTFVEQLFQGHVRYTIRCSRCGTDSHRDEPFFDLQLPLKRAPPDEVMDPKYMSPSVLTTPVTAEDPSRHLPVEEEEEEEEESGETSLLQLPVTATSWVVGTLASTVASMYHFMMATPPSLTMDDCMRAFFGAEELTGENQFKCDRCAAYVDARRTLSLKEAPEYFLITLKRFRFDQQYAGKLNAHLDLSMLRNDKDEIVLSLDKFTSSYRFGEEQLSDLYTLDGVICHHGQLGGRPPCPFEINHAVH